ncbi:PAS domain-containing protein [Humitalea sp. 24SJ18S-53]|uniref:PAS domain-containing protein n=1 Tax=Humitalea sp. 24SJ18S-53 TaxID=3422307 RepID=UPI003D66BE78
MPIALRALFVMLVALFPTALVQLQMESQARQERTVQLGEQAMRLARLVAAQQSRTFEAARQVLVAMAAHEAIAAAVPSAECDAYLARLVASSPRYYTANLFGPDGKAICAAQPMIGEASVADRQYFRAAIGGQDFVAGEFGTGRATGRQSFYLAAPLRDGYEVRGVMVVALSIEWLNGDLLSLDLPPDSIATIADSDGTVIARSRDAARFVGTALPAFAMTMLEAPRPGVVDSPSLEGLRRIVGYIPSNASPDGIFVAMGLDAEPAVAAEVARQRQTTLMIVGSLLLTLALATLFFQATVERPIRRLLDTAQRWARQDWRARVGKLNGGGQEFERLGAAFDRMAEEVQEREAARDRATTRMRALVEVSPQIVFTADTAGGMTWLNGYWLEFTGMTESDAMGEGWLAAVHPDDQERVRKTWATAIEDARQAGPGGYGIEIRLCRAHDKEWRWFLNKAAPIRDTDGVVTGWTGVAIDFHDLRAAQSQASEGAARLRATYDSAPVGLCLLDEDLRFVAVNGVLAAANGPTVEAHIGRRLEELAPHMAVQVAPLLRRVVETGEAVEDVEVPGLEGGRPGEDRVWLCSYQPVRGAAGNLLGVSGAVLDITARKRSQEAERLLSREVDHRAKNALAVVRSLIRLSAAQTTHDVSAMVEILEGRIAAMARVHTVLAREKWVAADLAEIVAEELDAHADRCTLGGPDVRLRAEAAQPLTLVLHELVTNASKYGALSAPGGRLTVDWMVDADGVLLEWTERGGPRIEQRPTWAGFGTQLIEANAGAQLDGGITRFWDPEGLRCVLRIGPEAILGEPSASGGADPVLSGRRVLLVHDDAENAAHLAAALTAVGCIVAGPVPSTTEAISLIHALGPIDAAVLATMPGGRSVQPVLDLVRRRAVAVVLLATDGIVLETGADLPVLETPTTAEALMGALRACFVALKQEA